MLNSLLDKMDLPVDADGCEFESKDPTIGGDACESIPLFFGIFYFFERRFENWDMNCIRFIFSFRGIVGNLPFFSFLKFIYFLKKNLFQKIT